MSRFLRAFLSIVLTAACVALFAAPSAAWGSADAPSGSKMSKQSQKWQQRISKIDSMLEAGEAKPARKQADQLLRELHRRSSKVEGWKEALGAAYRLRAVATSALGEKQDAIWQWFLVLQLFPDLEPTDLSRFGEAGQWLMDHPLESAPAPKVFPDGQQLAKEDLSEGITPPRKIRSPKPSFSNRAKIMGQFSAHVLAWVDEQGVPGYPRIQLAEGDFSMVCEAMDAFMEWRFEPAQINGEPVGFHYLLTVNYNK